MDSKLLIVMVGLLFWVICYITYQIARITDLPRFRKRFDAVSSFDYGMLSQHKLELDTTISNPNDNIKIFCIIFTMPKNAVKAKAVKETWAKRCDKYLFFSNVSDPKLPMVGLDMKEERQYLPVKSRLSFEYVYKHYGDDYDWYFKADDDTYVVVENLRHHLRRFDPNEPVQVGKRFHKFKGLVKYMSGGAGYGFSRSAVKSMVSEEGCFRNYTVFFRGGMEDVAIGQCAKYYNFKFINISTDALNREKFHSLNPRDYLDFAVPKWLYRYSYSTVKLGKECCSNETITFHYISPVEMYMIELLLYQIKVAKT